MTSILRVEFRTKAQTNWHRVTRETQTINRRYVTYCRKGQVSLASFVLGMTSRIEYPPVRTHHGISLLGYIEAWEEEECLDISVQEQTTVLGAMPLDVGQDRKSQVGPEVKDGVPHSSRSSIGREGL